MILLFVGLIIFRLLCLSFFLSLIYSVAIIITFIFVIMTLDQSEILLRENYNFIPVGLILIFAITLTLSYEIWHDGRVSPSSREIQLPSVSLSSTYFQFQFGYFLFTSSAMTATRKVNKDLCFGNNLILENDLGVLSLSLYTELNGIVMILGLGFFVSLVNCFLIIALLQIYDRLGK